eukprot:CAMPEP_0171462488 /NCGR_PEP_ID=MMETSP0945-20130129/6505_1 /TAXON_ID=109269 /ORGANISM="Vaucheria litorea, Strain CCMP2940" /LENGTH=44 /DNA_ID= /DNA_START= /DNA_END= /DNA_ORIENTATION=
MTIATNKQITEFIVTRSIFALYLESFASFCACAVLAWVARTVFG